MSPSSQPLPGTNLAVLIGSLSRAPEPRQLPSGDELLALEVTVRPAAGPADTVPVAWFSPSAASAAWTAGQPVAVVGRVRRRFFRAGGATQSRVEVVATAVVPGTRRRAVRSALAAAARQLDDGMAA